MTWSGEEFIAYRYGMGLLVLAGLSIYGMVALARGVRGDSLCVGAIELRSGVATTIGLLLQLPLLAYLILGYVTGALSSHGRLCPQTACC